MLTEELMQGAQKYLMDTYTRYPLALARGQGTRVFDVEGREYLDFLAGVAVNVLGHCHPKVTLALQQQALRLVHTSNLFYTEPKIKLARILVDRFEVWTSRRACCCSASVTFGWQWQRTFTATPARKSRYSRPSTSNTRVPCPLASARGYRVYVSIRYF